MNAAFKNYFNRLLVVIGGGTPAISRAQWLDLGSGISSSPHTILSMIIIGSIVTELDIKDLAEGVYIYKLSYNQIVLSSGRIIKQ